MQSCYRISPSTVYQYSQMPITQ